MVRNRSRFLFQSRRETGCVMVCGDCFLSVWNNYGEGVISYTACYNHNLYMCTRIAIHVCLICFPLQRGLECDKKKPLLLIIITIFFCNLNKGTRCVGCVTLYRSLGYTTKFTFMEFVVHCRYGNAQKENWKVI